jgi:hypothetical protein
MASETSASYTSTPSGHHLLTGDINTPVNDSQTSNSPSAISDDLHRRSHAQSGLPNDATVLLSDLFNFLALGCLVYEDAACDLSSPSHSRSCGDWQDVIVPVGSLGVPLSKLTAAGWIRILERRSDLDDRYIIYRIYILPSDVGLRFIDRDSKKLLSALQSLVANVDVSPSTWNGHYLGGTEVKFDPWASRDEGSLFYMFNKLPSPCPDPSKVKEKYAREAVEDILDASSTSSLIGLKTSLYPYQRRSAALMLQRESVSTLSLDPRLEPRTAPDGSLFYFGSRDLQFNRNPRYYEASRGGILAETMGLGKTLMCLSLILATRHHLPKVPAAYRLSPIRNKTASLADMAVAAINRISLPWKIEFERIQFSSQDDMSSCARKLESDPPSYEIPVEPVRWNRKTVIPPPVKKTLAATTILVVPRNLCKQWHSEIQKHVQEGVLRILLMEEAKAVLPAPNDLRGFDVILFSRSRFEMEIKDGADNTGRRLLFRPPPCNCPYVGATRTVDCHCVKLDDLYQSPLKHLHFKRLIIDEGHFFSASNTTAVSVAERLVTADHRWVISGTPAKDLLGVEADMSVAQNISQPGTVDSRDAVLNRRCQFGMEDTSGAIKSLGLLASNFLRIRPWAAEAFGERPAVWDEHIYRHEDYRKRTYSGFSSCLRRTLEAMVIKTQPEDVEQDIDLPALSHEVIRLQPSFYDKLTANMFAIVLTANAVTSERTDADYLFHKKSAQARYQLIGNLRQSAFFWTGFSEEDVEASKKNSRGYLDKADTHCSDEDRHLLTEAMHAADSIISSVGWRALSQSHELGVFIDSWPEESADFWAFSGIVNPLLTGISQLLEAQKHVNERVGLEDPGEGLAGVGIRALMRAKDVRRDGRVARKEMKPVLSKAGINLSGEPSLKRRAFLPAHGDKGATKRVKKSTAAGTKTKTEQGAADNEAIHNEHEVTAPLATEPSTSKRRWSDIERSELSENSPFARSRLTGTTSAKLSYLTSQILKYYRNEKILVFYEGDNIAYYIAQMLELLHVKHEIYARSLAAALKSEYVVRFNEEPQDRVLLMDIKHASHGLNISSASRIYFVNPVCRPDVEAQAIKRAHRIGQTRKVFVETLLLAGTIEEKMHERAKRMTNLEHHVSHLEDDYGMRKIIQGASIIPVMEHEYSGTGQMAALDLPQRLWGRPGWRESLPKSSFLTSKSRSADDLDVPSATAPAKRMRKKKMFARLAIPRAHPSIVANSILPTTQGSDSSGTAGVTPVDEIDEEDQPIIAQWMRQPQETRVGIRGVAPSPSSYDTEVIGR